MNFELKKLFEFQFLIIDMQKLIVEHRKKGVPEATLQASIARVDNLIEIYKTFEKYYYSAHYANQKVAMLEQDKIEMSVALMREIEELKAENTKLLETLNYNNAA